MIAISLSMILLGPPPLRRHQRRCTSRLPVRRGRRRIPQVLLVILPPLLLNDLAIMVVAIVIGIVMSHRIAGPIYRIAEDIDRVLSGERGVRVQPAPQGRAGGPRRRR